MRRLLVRRLTRGRSVVDGVFCNPVPPSERLLQDLSFEDLCAHFPKDMVHAPCSAVASGLFALSKTHRALALLPVTTVRATIATTAWAPFLVDCGSPGTFFSRQTETALKLDTADHVRVCDKGLIFQQSSGHFDSINLLGTDVMRHGELLIRYPSAEVSFRVTNPPGEILVTDGKVTFPVKPEKPTVMHLKKAIKEYGMYALPPFHIIVKDPATGKAMGDKDVLHAGVEYVYELPKL